MKFLSGLASLLIVGSGLVAHAQGSDNCSAPVALPVEAGMRLAITARPAEIDVVGTDQLQIRISCTLDDPSRAGEVRIRFQRTGEFGRLAISGGPRNNVRIRVEVPHQTHLKLRIPAGEVRVSNLDGDKDLDAKAGQIVVSGVNPQQYRFVYASVQIGEVNAPSYGAQKGGFFRSLQRTSPEGLYRLNAHVITGSIQLN